MNGLIIQSGLSEEQFTAVRGLAKLVADYDGVEVKINYGMVEIRKPDMLHDFCWYADGSLVAYMPLDLFGEKGEITALVHPEYRRQGIFSAMYRRAVEAAKRDGCTSLLMVAYRNSESGNAVVHQLGLQYETSEYRMDASLETIPGLTSQPIAMVPVTSQTVPQLCAMIHTNFGGAGCPTVEELESRNALPDHGYWFAIEDEYVGHLGWIHNEQNVYICAVGVMPEHRGKGYGRRMLAEAMRRFLKQGVTSFQLEVETQNENALSLYTGCGFRSGTVFDYYKIPMS